jgi:energy-coupling factor transport system ATP-binding protein
MMGRNGSGKSTLLRCIVGLLRATRGEIAVRGRATAGRDVADICRDLAYLPQNPDDLLFAESVEQELETTLQNHGLLSNGKGAERLTALLSELGLLEHAHAYPRDLSVGQRQRVALGAVMITEPELLLLDEPTRGLDAVAKQGLAGLWKRWRDAGKGILLVTHDVELAAQVADRVVFVSDGEIIASGPAIEVMGASPLFSPQIARLFPGRGWLTVADALVGLGHGN